MALGFSAHKVSEKVGCLVGIRVGLSEGRGDEMLLGFSVGFRLKVGELVGDV